MQNFYLRYLAVCAFLVCLQLPGFSQAVKLTNLPYASFSVGSDVSQNLFPYGNSLYFIGRSAADVQEWQKLDLITNNVTLATTSHYRNSTGNSIFRDPVRFGDNVFVSSAAPNNLQDLEFSRFNLATATEQWVDIATGYYSTTPALVANSSDPILYARAANGKVYFRPATPTTGNQIWYWNPATQNIAKLTSINEPAGLSQNTGASMAIIGDTLYTAYNATSGSSYTNFIRININNGLATTTAAPFNITSVRSMNGKIYFSARATATASIPYNLYVYNPETGITKLLTNYSTTAPTTTGSTALRDIIPGNDGITLYVNVGITTSSSANQTK